MLMKEQYGIPDEHIFNSRDTSFVKVRSSNVFTSSTLITFINDGC